MSSVNFVELDDRIVGAPGPDTHVVALGPLIGPADDVEFDDSAIGRDIHNAIAPNVIQHIAANYDPEAGIPLRPHPVCRPAKDPAAVNARDVIVLDAQIDEPARLGVANGMIVNAAVDLLRVGSVHIVDVEILEIKMMKVSGVLCNQVHSATSPKCRASIHDLKIANLPILLILEQDRIFGVSFARQAAYVRQAFAIARANPRIDVMVWFMLRDDTNLTLGWQSGMLTATGKKKPAFTVFARLPH